MMKENDLKKLIEDLRILWLKNGYDKFKDYRLNLIIGNERLKLKTKDDFKLVIRTLNLVLKENRKPSARIIHKVK